METKNTDKTIKIEKGNIKTALKNTGKIAGAGLIGLVTGAVTGTIGTFLAPTVIRYNSRLLGKPGEQRGISFANKTYLASHLLTSVAVPISLAYYGISQAIARNPDALGVVGIGAFTNFTDLAYEIGKINGGLDK